MSFAPFAPSQPRGAGVRPTGPTAAAPRRVVAAPRAAADACETLPLPPSVSDLRWGIGAEQGPRETMEDVIQVEPSGRCGFFFATVFDGHAGIAAARYLETNLYKIFAESLDMHGLELDVRPDDADKGLCCPLELHDVLTDCYRRADQDLLKWLRSQPPGEADSGCTATTALVRSDRIIVANVGDSRAVLSRRGAAMDLSTEHRVYGRGPAVASEIERVEAVGGWVDDGRVCGMLAVSRAFGDGLFKEPKLKELLRRGAADGYFSKEFAATVRFTGEPVTSEPDVFEVGMEPGDDEFLIVATDGLWDVLSSSEAVQLARADFRRGRHPEEIAQRLAALAVKRYTPDNTGVVVVDLLGEERWGAAGGGNGGKKKLFGLF